MGRHTGEAPDAEGRPTKLNRRRLLTLSAGITATLVAWGFLVWLAIDFGGEARAGESVAWVMLLLATVGATACLFVTLILGSKILAALQGAPAPPPRGPRSPQAGKRAAR